MLFVKMWPALRGIRLPIIKSDEICADYSAHLDISLPALDS
jgi:hypothetical protein